MKVFEVITFSSYDFETEVYTEIFSTREKAKEYFDHQVETTRLEAEEYLAPDEIESCYLDDYYEVYRDGRASEYEVNIRIREKEVK